MPASIMFDSAAYPLDTSCETVLQAIQKAGIAFAAPCGGNQTCGKCGVLIRDEQVLRQELACMVAPAEDMTVFVETEKPMAISEFGIAHPFAADAGQAGTYGLSVDIGTTTVVARLYDLASGECLAAASRPNPQVAYGADVIARISASMEGKLPVLTRLIQSALDAMADQLCQICGIERSAIVRTAVAGNTVMESIAAAVSPDPIGVNPFIPLDYFGHRVELPKLAPEVHFARCLSGYVGGDITADILACGMMQRHELTLLLDLGTNGEMAMGNCEKVLTCATAAGPVFEGANIAYGMPARAGAISQVTLTTNDAGQQDIAIRTVDDAEPIGICGTGIIDAVALLLNCEIIDETGYLEDPEDLPGLSPALAARIEETDAGNRFRLTENIFITQADIRNVQLAKAAVCAGIYTMLNAYGAAPEDVNELLIAGGFGKFLNLDSAAAIGLFPAEMVDRAQSIGNAAIEGASALLVSQEAGRAVETIADANAYLELSTSAAFNGFYVDCMMFE